MTTLPSAASVDSDGWSGELTQRLWWRRFPAQQLEEIITGFRDALPAGELRSQLTVELTHVRYIGKRAKANRSVQRDGFIQERRVFQKLTAPGQIERDLKVIESFPESDVRSSLFHLMLRCSAASYSLELRIGSSGGTARQRATVHASWPGRSPWLQIESVLKNLGKSHRFWRFYALFTYVLAVQAAIGGAIADGHYLWRLVQAPNADSTELASTFAVHGVGSLIIGFLLWWICFVVGVSRVSLRAGKVARMVVWSRESIQAMTVLKRFPRIRSYLTRIAPNDGPVAIILGVFALIVSILAWLFPR